MFNTESRRNKKLYRQRLNEVKEKLRQVILSPGLRGTGGTDDKSISSNVMEIWGFALLVEEATTLSRLTKWLTILSAILSVLTVVLAYPMIRNLVG